MFIASIFWNTQIPVDWESFIKTFFLVPQFIFENNFINIAAVGNSRALQPLELFLKSSNQWIMWRVAFVHSETKPLMFPGKSRGTDCQLVLWAVNKNLPSECVSLCMVASLSRCSRISQSHITELNIWSGRRRFLYILYIYTFGMTQSSTGSLSLSQVRDEVSGVRNV